MASRWKGLPISAAPALRIYSAPTTPCCRNGTKGRCRAGRPPIAGSRGIAPRRPLAADVLSLGRLPAAVRRAYLAGELHLLPFPGSLAFLARTPYLKLQKELPLAVQIPLLHSLQRHEAPWGIRIPQSGWMHEARPGPPPHPDYGPIRGGSAHAPLGPRASSS